MNRDPTDPMTASDPPTGVHAISPEEFAKKVAAVQLNGTTNGATNGAHHPSEPDESFWAQGDEASFVPYKDERSEQERREIEASEKLTPPVNTHAEACVLVAEILQPDLIPKIRSIISRSDFGSESYALIHEACLYLHDEGRPIDPPTVLHQLFVSGSVKTVTRHCWEHLLTSVPVYTNAVHYAKMVAETASIRRIYYECDRVRTGTSLTGKGDIPNLIEQLRSVVESYRPERPFQTRKDVIKQWIEDGELVHEPTGIPPLDNVTGGGPVYGSRWIVNGAPDAGKTALLVQIADTYARRGVCVGILAADEESSDIETRMAQREGFSRLDCEVRNTNTIGLMLEAAGEVPVRYYRADITIEAASDDLALWARQRGSQAALFVDSIQTVVCSKVLGTDDISTRELVTENVRALKNAAMRHKIIAIATSEMNRSAYRNGKDADQNDMASGAESRAIEYLARVLVTLRSVKGEPDLVEVAIPKNKHGRSGENFFLRIDRRRMTLFESEGPCAANLEAAKEDERALKERLAAEALAAREASTLVARQTLWVTEESAMVMVVREQPGIGTHKLRAAMAAKLDECGRTRTEDCLARLQLKKIIRSEEGGPGKGTRHYLNG